MGPEVFFPANPGRHRFWFWEFWFCGFFGPQISGFPGPDLKLPDFQVSRFPRPQISKFTDFQVPGFPDAGASGTAGRTFRSQPDPSPNAPRDQIRSAGRTRGVIVPNQKSETHQNGNTICLTQNAGKFLISRTKSPWPILGYFEQICLWVVCWMTT